MQHEGYLPSSACMCSLIHASCRDAPSPEDSAAIGEGGTHSLLVVDDGDPGSRIHLATAVGGEGGILSCGSLTWGDCRSDVDAVVGGEGGTHACD